jgi:hypothetical protein
MTVQLIDSKISKSRWIARRTNCKTLRCGFQSDETLPLPVQNQTAICNVFLQNILYFSLFTDSKLKFEQNLTPFSINYRYFHRFLVINRFEVDIGVMGKWTLEFNDEDVVKSKYKAVCHGKGFTYS